MQEQDIFSALIGIISLLLILASSIVGFVILYTKRVRRYQEMLRENERKQELNLLNAAISAQENERQRIGADIHDDIGPLLATTKMLLNKFKYLTEKDDIEEHVHLVGDRLDEVIFLIRTVAKNLVPQVLVEFGLEEAIDEICSRINSGNEVQSKFTVSGDLSSLTNVQQLALYRIIQEFCNNTLKHANAVRININCECNTDRLVLRLSDDGKGISEEQYVNSAGLGVKNMQARAKSIGANISLDVPSHIKGTTIVIQLNL